MLIGRNCRLSVAPEKCALARHSQMFPLLIRPNFRARREFARKERPNSDVGAIQLRRLEGQRVRRLQNDGSLVDDNWDEQQIVRGLRDGNPDAWAALCSLYSERLWRYVARLIGSDSSAVADVFQETMLAVAGSGRNLASGSRLWSWLATIGHNQCALYWRKRIQVGVGSPIDQRGDSESGEDVLLRQETVEAVRLVLSEMPGDYVVALTAKYSEQKSVQEIASALRESEEAVRSRLARARREFRKRYEAMSNQTVGQLDER